MTAMPPKWKKNKKQILATQMHAAAENVMLYGGSRSGKTYITLRNIIIRACKKKSRHVILRLNYNACKKSVWLDTLPKVWKDCFGHLPPLESLQNKSDLYLTLPNGSEIWFGGLDNAKKIEKIFGTEYSTMYFNECSQIPYESILDALTRLAENSGLNLRAYFDCNPPSKKHWTYVLFVEGLNPVDRTPVLDFETEYASVIMNPDDNRANLPASYLRRLDNMPKKQRERYRDGLFSSDTVGALWSSDMVNYARGKGEPHGEQIRTVVGVDPAITNTDDSDLWGIVVASIYHGKVDIVDGEEVEKFEGYVRADHSLKASPNAAVKKAIWAYDAYSCDALVVEVNQGGDMVEDLLRLNNFKGKIIKVRASRGKHARAEPISAIYEQGLIGHAENLDSLEEDLTSYVPFTSKQSPDRLDAQVCALTDLFLGKTSFSWDVF